MFEDGIVKSRQRGFDPETSMYCFGGGGGDGGGSSESKFEKEPAPVATPNYTRTLPNGIVVEDYSRPYNEMPSTPAPTPVPSQTARQGFYNELATNLPDMGVVPQRQQTRVGEIISASPMDMFNNAPVTAGQALNEALAPGQIGGGRIGIGGGVSVGRVPGGYGIQYDRRFAQGGPVTAGIGSLGLPQAMLKSTKI